MLIKVKIVFVYSDEFEVLFLVERCLKNLKMKEEIIKEGENLNEEYEYINLDLF